MQFACSTVAAVYCEHSPSWCGPSWRAPYLSVPVPVRCVAVVPVTVADVEQSTHRQSDGAGKRASGGGVSGGGGSTQGADPRLTAADQGSRHGQRVAGVRRSAARRRPQVHDGSVSARVRPVPHLQRTCRPAAQALVCWHHSNDRPPVTTCRPASLYRRRACYPGQGRLATSDGPVLSRQSYAVKTTVWRHVDVSVCSEAAERRGECVDREVASCHVLTAGQRPVR